MNTTKLRSKRVILPTIAAVVALGIGGVVWTSAANADVQSGERDRVADAATQAVPGEVTDVETSDDLGEAYEVEVRQADGTEVDVALDKNLKVVAQDDDGRDDRDDDGDRGDTADNDDRALSASERASAEKAALGAVKGGTVTQVETSDDRGEAYEVDVRGTGNTEWDVELDADFEVVGKTLDK